MKLGIDWVSMAILLGAYLFSRIPGVNARLGNAALAIACGVIAGYRFRMPNGTVGINLLMVGLACAFCLYYLSRTISGAGTSKRTPPSDSDEQ
jgi:hypothetical protein